MSIKGTPDRYVDEVVDSGSPSIGTVDQGVGTGDLGAWLVSDGSINATYTSSQVPTLPFLAGATFTGSEWIDIRHMGSFIFLLASTQPFATVQLQWSSDGSTFNGTATNLTNQPTAAGPLLYNVYLSINNLDVVSGTHVRVRVVNGASDQDATMIGIFTVSKDTYSPLIGINATLSFIQSAILTRSVIAGLRRNDQTFANVGLSPTDALFVRSENIDVTKEGSQFTEGIIDTISLAFSRDQGQLEIDNHLLDVGTGGSVTLSPTTGQAVFATGAGAGDICYFRSDKTVVYEPGHELRAEQTIEIDATNIAGTASVEWGIGEDDGASDILNGIFWRYDVNGLHVVRRVAGVDVSVTDQADFNRDPLDGSSTSLFRFNGTAQAIDLEKNNYFLTRFEWLGSAPPTYEVQGPSGSILRTHVEETGNNITGSSIPEPNLPVFLRVTNDTTVGGIVSVRTGSWRGGVYTNRIVATAQQPDGDFVNTRADGTFFDESTPLGAAGVFTSPWFDSDGWGVLEFIITASHVSASNGIEIEFTDNTSVAVPTVIFSRSLTYDADAVSAGVLFFRVPAALDGFRFRYTNGGTPQTDFFVEASGRVVAELPLGTLKSGVGPTAVASMTRTIAFAENDLGAFGNIMRGDSGGLRAAINEHEVETPIQSLSSARMLRTSLNATTATEVTASAPLAGRRSISLKAVASGSAIVYIGFDNAVTAANGYPLANDQSVDIELDDTQLIWAITSSGTQAVSVMEIGL